MNEQKKKKGKQVDFNSESFESQTAAALKDPKAKNMKDQLFNHGILLIVLLVVFLLIGIITTIVFICSLKIVPMLITIGAISLFFFIYFKIKKSKNKK